MGRLIHRADMWDYILNEILVRPLPTEVAFD